MMNMLITAGEFEKVINKCGFMNGLCLSSYGLSGSMGLRWRDVDVKIIFYDGYYIVVIILDSEGYTMWNLVGYYGWSDNQSKYLIWELIRMTRLMFSGLRFINYV